MIITDRMTIEEIMVLFNEEYGDDFNWHLIPFSDHSLEMELRKELSVSDDFFKGKVCMKSLVVEEKLQNLFKNSLRKSFYRVFHFC